MLAASMTVMMIELILHSLLIVHFIGFRAYGLVLTVSFGALFLLISMQ